MKLQSTTIGNATASILDGVVPDDDASKTPLNVPREVPKKDPPATPVKEEPVKDKVDPKKEEPKKEEPKPELVNPHLAEVKTEPVKPVTTETGEGDPKGMTGKALESWKAIKAESKTLAKENGELKSEMDKMRTQLAELEKSRPDIEALRKELAQAKDLALSYEGEMSITRVEGTREWKRNVMEPQRDIATAMTEIAKRYEVPAEDLMRAIQEPDAAKRTEALSDLIADFKQVDQIEVAQAAKDWQKTYRIASQMRENASQQLEQLSREEQKELEQHATLTAQDFVSAVDQEWEGALARNPFMRKVEGNDQWNHYIDELKRAAGSVNVNELPVEDVAKMAVSHLILPDMQKALEHFQKQNSALKTRAEEAEKKLADYKATAPGAGAGGRSTSTGGKGGNGNGTTGSGWKVTDVVLDGVG